MKTTVAISILCKFEVKKSTAYFNMHFLINEETRPGVI